jgi:hypothetical protein
LGDVHHPHERLSGTEHPTNEDYYDPLWDVVHNLAAPQLFGDIDSELVAEYLGQVERLES